jgi:hypothetical protein
VRRAWWAGRSTRDLEAIERVADGLLVELLLDWRLSACRGFVFLRGRRSRWGKGKEVGTMGGSARCPRKLRSSWYMSDPTVLQPVDVEPRLSQFLFDLRGAWCDHPIDLFLHGVLHERAP